MLIVPDAFIGVLPYGEPALVGAPYSGRCCDCGACTARCALLLLLLAAPPALPPLGSVAAGCRLLDVDGPLVAALALVVVVVGPAAIEADGGGRSTDGRRRTGLALLALALLPLVVSALLLLLLLLLLLELLLLSTGLLVAESGPPVSFERLLGLWLESMSSSGGDSLLLAGLLVALRLALVDSGGFPLLLLLLFIGSLVVVRCCGDCCCCCCCCDGSKSFMVARGHARRGGDGRVRRL